MRAKKLRAFVSMLCLGAIGSIAVAAHATSASNARLTAIQVSGTNVATLTIDFAVSGRPSCHFPLAEFDYAFDISTNKGKALLQLAQGAFLANKKVNIVGGATCTGSIETVQTLRVVAQ